MTPKQEERIRNKIAKIRKELAADKQRWGGFHHDGRGLRYLPPELFITLRDYKGGLRYLRWFDRTFTDDSGFPIFLFEWTLILFKTGNLKEAETKALNTFEANIYLIDSFLGKEITPVEMGYFSNMERAQYAEKLDYSINDPEFADFGAWLTEFTARETFRSFANELIAIKKQLLTEPVGEKRSALVDRLSELTEQK